LQWRAVECGHRVQPAFSLQESDLPEPVAAFFMLLPMMPCFSGCVQTGSTGRFAVQDIAAS
jgi:hypothetical protein